MYEGVNKREKTRKRERMKGRELERRTIERE